MKARFLQTPAFIVGTVLLLFLTACLAIRDPMPVCYTTIIGDTYVFSRRLGSTETDLPIGELEVRKTSGGSPQFVWRIELQDGPAVNAVTYGHVPRGYIQILPAARPPQRLQEGEEYELTCDNGLGRFVITPEGVKDLGPP